MLVIRARSQQVGSNLGTYSKELRVTERDTNKITYLSYSMRGAIHHHERGGDISKANQDL
ncbi:hypothetical protein GCM10009563_10570 [Subtercola frigoramans]